MITSEIQTHDIRMNSPIIVCGVGRSGTSLLQSMLNAHPRVSFTPETHFFRKYLAHRRMRKRREALGSNAFANELLSDDEFGRAKISPESLLEPFQVGREEFTLRNCYERLLTLYARQEKKVVVGDKDPRFIDHLGELHSLFPMAKVLHIVRDPRDVLLSRMKAEWSAERPWWCHSMIYDAQFHRGRQAGKRLFGENYYEVRYEDLISQPQNVLEQICRLIGIEFHCDMLEFSESAKRLVNKNELSWKSETCGALLTENRNKWRGELSASQIRWTECLCRESLSDFNYPFAAPAIEANWMVRCVSLLAIICRVLGRWCYPVLLALRG